MPGKTRTASEEISRISRDIRYCALFGEDGKVLEEHVPRKGADGRRHAQQFSMLIGAITSPPRQEAPGTAEAPEATMAPRYALLDLPGQDILVVPAPKANVAAVIRKGARPAALAYRIARDGKRPLSVRGAGALVAIYSLLAILPGLILSSTSYDAFWRDGAPVHLIVIAFGIPFIILGLLALANLPGYFNGDLPSRKGLAAYLGLNTGLWIFLGLMLAPLLLFAAVPIAFFALNSRKENKVYFNLA